MQGKRASPPPPALQASRRSATPVQRRRSASPPFLSSQPEGESRSFSFSFLSFSLEKRERRNFEWIVTNDRRLTRRNMTIIRGVIELNARMIVVKLVGARVFPFELAGDEEIISSPGSLSTREREKIEFRESSLSSGEATRPRTVLLPFAQQNGGAEGDEVTAVERRLVVARPK